MRLTEEIMRQSDSCHDHTLAQTLMLAAAGRFGLMPAKEPFRCHLNLRFAERCGHLVKNLLRDRVLDNHYGIVDITSLNKVIGEKILYLVEKDESAAYRYLSGIIDIRAIMRLLDAEHLGSEIDRNVISGFIRRRYPHPGTAFFIRDLYHLRDIDPVPR